MLTPLSCDREAGNCKTIVIRLSDIRQTILIFVKKLKNSTYATLSCDSEDDYNRNF